MAELLRVERHDTPLKPWNVVRIHGNRPPMVLATFREWPEAMRYARKTIRLWNSGRWNHAHH